MNQKLHRWLILVALLVPWSLLLVTLVALFGGCANSKYYQGFTCWMPDRNIQYVVLENDATARGDDYDIWAYDYERNTQEIVYTGKLPWVQKVLESILPADCRILGVRSFAMKKSSKLNNKARKTPNLKNVPKGSYCQMTIEKTELYEKIWLVLDEHDGDTDAQTRAILKLMAEEGFLVDNDEECPLCGGVFGLHEFRAHISACTYGQDDDDEDDEHE